MGILLISLSFAFILGFAAHRAGVCTVAAVGELITAKSARIFLSFAKVILWVLLVNGIAQLLMPELKRPYFSASLSLPVLMGGFIFGIGAAINGGCSFSTISKIAQGNFHVALTLPAFVGGILVYRHFVEQKPSAMDGIHLIEYSESFSFALLVLSVWAIRELFIIVRPMIKEGDYWSSIRAKRYRLSTGAALIGICSGFLYLIHGRWAYTSKLIEYFTGSESTQSTTGSLGVYLLLALLIGAVASAVSSRQFSFTFEKEGWYKNVSGGFLMGFGAMMIPGGNAKLILQDIPQLSVHAIVAYSAMVAGIALTLLLLHRITGEMQTVNCAGDRCQTSGK